MEGFEPSGALVRDRAGLDSLSLPGPDGSDSCSSFVPSSAARSAESPKKLSADFGVRLPWFRAALYQDYIRLREQDHFTVVVAARAVGLPASLVSGKDSMLRRYLGQGIVGLVRPRNGMLASDLAGQIEALGWFIPAAQFFYLTDRNRRGALARAVRRAAALPKLPLGWRKETVARFLERLDLQALPECPATLQAELVNREQASKPIVPPRIARLIQASPSSVRCYCVEAPAEKWAQIKLGAITKRLAELEPRGTCRLTIELL